MGKQKLFNFEQEKFILDNYNKMSNNAIAKKIGEDYTAMQINSWLQHRNLKKNNKGLSRVFTEEEIDFIKKNYAILTCAQIGRILGFPSAKIKGKADHLNLLKKIREINENYFEYIDTGLKAYFLGFIYADGWVVNNETSGSYEFGMELQSCDKYILEKLNDELGGKNIISHSNPKEILICKKQIAHGGHSDILRVYSKKLVHDLMNNGILPNKSDKDDYPIISDKFFFDFLRGYIDGDGCFYVNHNQTYMHITCASIKPLEYIQNKLNEFEIKTQIYTENEKKHRLMCTSFIGMKKLVNLLYYEEDLFCLERKYEKIKHFLGFAA